MHSRFGQDTEHAFSTTAALTNSFTVALCHHSHTYASLPLVQVCIYPTLMQIRFGQDTEHAFSTTAALHKQLHSSLVSPQSYLCKFAFVTGLRLPKSDTDQVWPRH